MGVVLSLSCRLLALDRYKACDPGETVSVTVSWVVDEEGRVTDLKVLESGGARLDEAVVAALSQWRYTPATKDGVKVKVKLARKYTYRTG